MKRKGQERVAASALLLALLLVHAPSIRADAGYRHAEEPIGTVREIYDGRLYPDIQVSTFRNIDRLFPTRIVHRGPVPRPLPQNPRTTDDFRFEHEG